MSIVATEDMNYLAQQTPGNLNMILAGMTALMNDIENKASAMESQNWFQRMAKTITGKNKLTLAEIQQNHEKLNAYMSEAIAELYNRNCIDHKVMVSLGVQINELYADHIQLKQMLGAFVSKLNEKIDSVDNFHMLITEIDHGVYSSADPIVAICRVMSQFDNRILEDDRKLDIISRSLHAQGILNGEQIGLTDYLSNILDMSIDDMGQVHLELGTIRGNFLASVMLGVMENYYFLPDLARKMKKKETLIEEIIRMEKLDASVSLSMDEIYEEFLNSKIDAKNGLIPIGEAAPLYEELGMSNGEDNFELGLEAYIEENYTQAVKYFRIAAENGYADAQFFLGNCYDLGEGVAQNKTEAFKWYLKAAEQGDSTAQCSVGDSYFNGEGVAQNKTEAFKWWMKAAEQGNSSAQFNVGCVYDLIILVEGVAQNKTEAFKWWMKAAEQDDSNAQFNVGCSYFNGEGVAQNKTEAFKWWMKAAEQGNSNAQYNIGSFYYFGEGVAQNKTEAFKWWMKAAEQDFPEAQFKVGCVYDLVTLVEGVAQNKTEAFKWYLKAAEQDHPDAQYNVGCCYAHGDGVMPSISEAFKWYLKAAEQGDPDAQFKVGKCYHAGNGTEQNYQKAKEWLKKAAEQGIDLARQKLWEWY